MSTGHIWMGINSGIYKPGGQASALTGTRLWMLFDWIKA